MEESRNKSYPVSLLSSQDSSLDKSSSGRYCPRQKGCSYCTVRPVFDGNVSQVIAAGVREPEQGMQSHYRTFERRKELVDDGGSLHQPAGWWSKCSAATGRRSAFPDLILTTSGPTSFAEVPGRTPGRRIRGGAGRRRDGDGR